MARPEGELPAAVQGLANLDAVCTVRVLVDKRGRVDPISVDGCPEVLADAARDQARRWRAAPSSENGRSELVGAELRMHYLLNAHLEGVGAGGAVDEVMAAGSQFRKVGPSTLTFTTQDPIPWPAGADPSLPAWCLVDLLFDEKGAVVARNVRDCDDALAPTVRAAVGAWRIDPWYRGGLPDSVRTAVWVRVGDPPPPPKLDDAGAPVATFKKRVAPDMPAADVTCDAAMTINEIGSIVRVDVVGCPVAYARATVDALLRWRAEPVMKDGQPVRTVHRERVSFADE